MLDTEDFAPIPLRWVGPIPLQFHDKISEEIFVPLATFESPLWPSVTRGARAASFEGITTTVLHSTMTRSVVLRGPNARRLWDIAQDIEAYWPSYQGVVSGTSRFCQLQSWHKEVHGTRLYARFSFHTAEASGHNMTTKAAQALIEALLKNYPEMSYGSISANLCTDKKPSAINAYLGRGRAVIAESCVPRLICQKILKTTPEDIVALHIEKNYLGGILAGSLRSANAHFANMLLGLYLALGQDAANIVEGAQGITFAEVDPQGDLYFSVHIPHLIVGVHGHGKHWPWVQKNLENLGCWPPDTEGDRSSQRLAQIMAATVLCGELSLLAAQTCPGMLVDSHMRLERQERACV